KTVKKVLLHNASLRWEVPADLVKILPGQTVQSVRRRSKYLLIDFKYGTLIIHL
ncbi:MAG: DNA-formamidopyrimidine glycosylase, partial [Gammaproteobacteria bacterium]|nr:DNA-formamidopyrimidine glycosylase [Gammaproteobacteria bacterium]NIW45469.1 DNA-formamidopyrimidine glycosylase [Gammaproteobacteria bacterium]